MYIKVSKAMCKEWRKNMKDVEYCVEDIIFKEMTPKEYEYYVDSYTFNHEKDYDFKKGVFKVLCVIYKDDCYAMNKYITTRDLNTCFNDSDKSYNGFFKALNNEVMI